MTTLSARPSDTTPPQRPAPRVIRGFAYGIVASMAMWVAIGAVAYKFF